MTKEDKKKLKIVFEGILASEEERTYIEMFEWLMNSFYNIDKGKPDDRRER